MAMHVFIVCRDSAAMRSRSSQTPANSRCASACWSPKQKASEEDASHTIAGKARLPCASESKLLYEPAVVEEDLGLCFALGIRRRCPKAALAFGRAPVLQDSREQQTLKTCRGENARNWDCGAAVSEYHAQVPPIPLP